MQRQTADFPLRPSRTGRNPVPMLDAAAAERPLSCHEKQSKFFK
jgi:hypothetical protein